MKVEKLSAVAELVSSIAILATLGYLAIQTQQNTQAIQATVRQSMLTEDRELLFWQFEYPWLDMISIDEREFSPDELFQVRAFLTAFFRSRENQWLQLQAGVIDEVTWSTYRSPLANVLRSEVVRENWRFRVERGEFTAGFVAEVDRMLAEIER